MNLFEMAATYVESVCIHHPFLDGNKRTGTACAVTFLYLNGYELHEKYDAACGGAYRSCFAIPAILVMQILHNPVIIRDILALNP